MKKPSARSSGGFVLLIVLGVLAVLAMLGVTFLTLQSLEKEASVSYLDSIRSGMVSASGVEDAIARMMEMNFSGNGPVQDGWMYWGKNMDGKGTQDLQVPLQEALRPSFAHESPSAITVNGVKMGFSGRMSMGAYGRNSEVYTLKIEDCSGRIYINDGVAAGPSSPVTHNMKRILNVLGQTLNVGDIGEKIVDRRPPQGYSCRDELIGRAGIDRNTYDKIKGYITTEAWVDTHVVNPVPLSAETLSSYPVGRFYARGTPPIYRYGSSGTFRGFDNKWKPFSQPMLFSPPADPAGLDHAVYAHDELNPVQIEITARAPVNVNTASKEVLIALITGLRGFFVAERRKDAPLGSDPLNGSNWGYAWLKQVHSYSPADKGAGALGYLYQTAPIIGPGSATTGEEGIAAQDIADEMIACRTRSVSSRTGINYSSVAWGGPFKTWRQFHQFCDSLVGTLLVDNRRIFFDEATTGASIPSASQQWMASQAIADVLKANFNPNLHLNELNPDRNLHLLVDKTDLICNSTEFSFAPTGIFEIESLGMILKPADGGNDVFTAANNRVMASKKTVAVVKLFDMVRQTSQKEFAAGTVSSRITPVRTNNNMTLETGPEVSQGNLPFETEHDGYIGLPTVGGDGNNMIPGGYSETPDGDPEYGEAMHAHFNRDFRAHYHASADYWNNPQLREDLGNIQVEAGTWNYPVPTDQADQFNHPKSWDFGTPGAYRKKEYASNINDKTEAGIGPYGPNDYPSTQGRHRLVRSFRQPSIRSGTALPATMDLIAPSDQRIDGAYIERGSSVAYWIDEGISWDSMQGVVSFWVKPNFFPEVTGKPRTFFSVSRWHATEPQYMQPTPFGLFFMPSHDQPAGTASQAEYASVLYNRNYMLAGVEGMGANAAGRFRPSSLAFGFGFTSRTGYNADFGDLLRPKDANGVEMEYGIEGGVNTPSLIHRFHKEGSYTIKVPVYKNVRKRVGRRRWQMVQELTGYNDVVIPYDSISMLRGHTWSHVVVKWMMIPRSQPYTTNEDLRNTWTYDIYVNGEPFASTTPATSKFYNTETQAPYRRPHFSVHSFEEKLDGTLGRHASTGRYVTQGTRTERVYLGRRRVAYTYTETEWVWVQTGTRKENRTRTVQAGTRDEVRTRTRTVQVGTREETRTRTVRAGWRNETQARTRQVQVGTREETRSRTRRVLVDTVEETRTRRIRVPEEYTETRQEWVKTGDRTYTVTVTKYVTEKVPQTRPEWQKVGTRTETRREYVRTGTRKIQYWSRDGEKILEREVPTFDWVERTYTVDVYDWVNVTREVTVTRPVQVQETRTEPVYELRTIEEKKIRYVYKDETYIVEVPVYETQPYTEVVSVPVYRGEEYTVSVRVPDYRTETYSVMVPIFENVTEQYTVKVPVYREETYTVNVPVYEYQRRTVPKRGYRYESVYEDRTVPGETVWVVDNKPIKIVANTFRLGEMSMNMPGSNEFPRNWTADSTVDEFYLWHTDISQVTDRYRRWSRRSRLNGRFLSGTEFSGRDVTGGNSLKKALNMYGRGRYFNPKSNEAIFTSAPLELRTESSVEKRILPGGEPGTALASRPVRVLGVSWTWYGESVDPITMAPILYDYENPRTPASLKPAVNVSLLTIRGETMRMNRDAGQAPVDRNGKALSIDYGTPLQYKVYFETNGSPDTVLLASAVLDDITICYSTGRIEFLAYYQE